MPRAQVPPAIAATQISGRVVDARDEAPLRRARVIVSSGERQVEMAFTDDDGGFTISNVPAGSLTVRFTKAGYASAAAAVRAGTEIRFALARSAAVMGRVIDRAGRPVSEAYVTGRLTGAVSQPASTRFVARTDSVGEYRLGSLPAGRYEITGVRMPASASVPGGRLEDQLFAPPDSFDIGRTVALSLNPGDEVHDVDFTIPGQVETCPEAAGIRQPEVTAPATITGRVTDASGAPLACAIVRVAGVGITGVPQVFTDRQGFYEIRGVPAGSFVLTVIKVDHIPLRYGQRGPSDAEVPVTLRERERRENVDFVLPRESIVSGTVVDEHGEPLEGIPVFAYPIRRTDGLPMNGEIIKVARATDDRGLFRITGLTPGFYVIAARGSGEIARVGRARGYIPTYHPATTEVSTAVRVPVSAGLDVAGIDITVSPVFTGTVSGTVLDAGGLPFSGTVSLSASRRSGAVLVDSRSVQTDRSGAFVFRNVARGDYVLKASTSTQFGMQYVTLVDADTAPVTLTLTEGASVEGRLVTEAAPETNLAGLTVSFLPADADFTPVGGFRRPLYGREPEGTFRMTGLVGPARITVPAIRSCDSCYLKAARVNGMDAVDTPFDFGLESGVYRGVEVVVSDAGAAIEGRVTDDGGTPVSQLAFSVVAIPASEALRYPSSRYLKMGRASTDGSFRIAGLPPGEYLVGAVRRIEALINIVPTSDPDALELVSARGQRVTVVERERRTLDLRLIPR